MGVGASLLVMTLINVIMYMAGSLKALIVLRKRLGWSLFITSTYLS